MCNSFGRTEYGLSICVETDAESPVDSLLKLFDNVYKEYCAAPERKSAN